jgi:hypothetical protein
MAPGGFTAAVKNKHPNAVCNGITLSTKKGGHVVLLEKGKANRIIELDVTMLKELSPYPPPHYKIPKTHPEYENFDLTK